MTTVLLIQFALKGALVLAATAAVAAAMRRGSAASRHLVWTIGVVATLALPLVRVAGPTWTVTIPDTALPGPAWSAVATTAEPAWPQTVDETSVRLAQGMADTPAASTAPLAINWPGALVAIWLLGFSMLAMRMVIGVACAARLADRATPVEDDGWLEAFDETAAALCVDRRVDLRMTSETSVPVACGLLRPAVLLPADAMTWAADRRVVVLLHELAHVRRRDCLSQAIAQLTCALHWFNPLAHLAVTRLRAEQERACDDLVLSTGTAAPVYADHLFEIARSFRTPAAPAWATLSMARPSQLEGRLMAILDNRCNRAPAGRRARLALSVSAVGGIVLLGALHVTAESPLRGAGAAIGSDVALASAAVTGGAELSPFLDAEPVPHPRPDPQPQPDADPAPVPRATAGFPEFFGMFASSQAPAAPGTQAVPEVTDDTRRRVADALATALNDENAEVRQRAIEGLSSMRDPRAVPALLKALADPSADLRQTAVEGLTQFDTAEARSGILTALKDANPDVRERAATATARTRNAQAVPALLPLLKDASVGVRERTAQALGTIGDASAIDALTAALKDADAGVREQAAMALGRIARGERRGPGRFVPAIPAMPPIRIGANGLPSNLTELAAFAEDMKAIEKDIEREVEQKVEAAFDGVK